MTFQHRAGVSPYTSPCGFAQTCVFAKQLLGPLPCGPLSGASLLPRLRDHFAEFLGSASPVGLRILSPSTCVGLRYGCARRHSGFSRRALSALPYSSSVRAAHKDSRGPLRCPSPAPHAGLPPPGMRLARASPHLLAARSAGISTCCPSATPSGLALGPDSPRADELHPGNLGYSAGGIPTPLSLLIPAFSLPGAPPPLTVRLPCAGNAPLPRRFSSGAPGFGGMFQPRTFSARGLSASELLRTLSMRGCFWANVLAVFEAPHPFPLNMHLGALAAGPGSSPLGRPTCLVRPDSWGPPARHSEFDILW